MFGNKYRLRGHLKTFLFTYFLPTKYYTGTNDFLTPFYILVDFSIIYYLRSSK